MGRSPLQTFRSVVMPQLWPAIAVGGLLVALFVISDFGAVSIMRFDSFTREIYISYKSSFDRTATAALGAVLVVLMLVLLWVNARLLRGRAIHRLGPGPARPPRPYALGRWRWPALGFCSALVAGRARAPGRGAGLLVDARDSARAGPPSTSPSGWPRNSLLTGVGAAIAGGLAALVVAVLAGRYPGAITPDDRARRPRRLRAARDRRRARARLLRHPRAAGALPDPGDAGLRAHRPLPAAWRSGRSAPRCCRSRRGSRRPPAGSAAGRPRSFARSPRRWSAAGSSPGSALVFLHAIKELPATLILAPIGFETLATEIWNQTSFGFYEASAIPALVLLAVAAPPALPALRARHGVAVRRSEAKLSRAAVEAPDVTTTPPPPRRPRCGSPACASATAPPAPSTGSSSRSRRARSAPCSGPRAAGRRRRCA